MDKNRRVIKKKVKKPLDPNKQTFPIGLDNNSNPIKPKYKYNSEGEIIF